VRSTAKQKDMITKIQLKSLPKILFLNFASVDDTPMTDYYTFTSLSSSFQFDSYFPILFSLCYRKIGVDKDTVVRCVITQFFGRS